MATNILAIGNDATPSAWNTAAADTLIKLYLIGSSAAGDVPVNAFVFLQFKDNAGNPQTVGRIGSGSGNVIGNVNSIDFYGPVEYRVVRPGGTAWTVGVDRAS